METTKNCVMKSAHFDKFRRPIAFIFSVLSFVKSVTPLDQCHGFPPSPGLLVAGNAHVHFFPPDRHSYSILYTWCLFTANNMAMHLRCTCWRSSNPRTVHLPVQKETFTRCDMDHPHHWQICRLHETYHGGIHCSVELGCAERR